MGNSWIAISGAILWQLQVNVRRILMIKLEEIKYLHDKELNEYNLDELVSYHQDIHPICSFQLCSFQIRHYLKDVQFEDNSSELFSSVPWNGVNWLSVLPW